MSTRKRPKTEIRESFVPTPETEALDSFFTIQVRGDSEARQWYTETFWANSEGEVGIERNYGDSLGALLLSIAADVAILTDGRGE